MTIQDHLVSRARSHWGNGNPIPLDLFYEMLGAGIDVDAEEKVFHNEQEH